jgi:hypothetical protein
MTVSMETSCDQKATGKIALAMIWPLCRDSSYQQIGRHLGLLPGHAQNASTGTDHLEHVVLGFIIN